MVRKVRTMLNFRDVQEAPVKKLRNVPLNLVLSRLIRDKPGLIGASITGAQQTGKSSYALMVMYELYEHNVDAVLENTVFTIEQLTEKISYALENKERLPCILWDDSSVHGGAGMYNIARSLVQCLSALGDTMGLATKGILLTSPSGDLIKAFRNYNFYRVQIAVGRHKFDRVARGYEFGRSPFDQRWGRSAFVDKFDTRIPFYSQYYKLREELSISVVRNMRDMLVHPEEKPFAFFEKGGKKYVEYDL